MALRPLNSIAGFSTGDPAVLVVQANGDITTTNLTANGLSNLGNVGNVTILGGSNGQSLTTDGLGNLTWAAPAVSNRAAPMPYLIPNGQSYIVNENFQGLYAQTITIDGELEVDGMLIQIPIGFDAEPTQVLYANNGTPTGNTNFTFTAASGNLAVPGNINVTGNVIPYEDDMFDLGASTHRWRNGYFGGNTIYLDTATISVDSNGYVVITNETGGEFIVAGNDTSNSTSLVNGTSNLVVYSNSNIAMSVNGASNVFVVTNSGANLNGNLSANTVQSTGLASNRSNKAVTTNTVIDSFNANTYRSAKYVIKSGNDDGYESLEVLLIHNNINSYITIYAAINDGGGNTVNITTGINSGNVELYATGLAANTVINLIGIYVPD